MKKICKGMAVFAIMVGLVCMASCVSVGDLVGSMFGGGSGSQIAFLEGQSGAPYAFFRLYSNGKLEGATPDNSGVPIKGKWESSGKTDSVWNGDTITVTIEEKTGKGTVRQISSKWVPRNPNDNGDKPDGDYTLITYSVNLGALGTYTFSRKDYGK